MELVNAEDRQVRAQFLSDSADGVLGLASQLLVELVFHLVHPKHELLVVQKLLLRNRKALEKLFSDERFSAAGIAPNVDGRDLF